MNILIKFSKQYFCNILINLIFLIYILSKMDNGRIMKELKELIEGVKNVSFHNEIGVSHILLIGSKINKIFKEERNNKLIFINIGQRNTCCWSKNCRRWYETLERKNIWTCKYIILKSIKSWVLNKVGKLKCLLW